MLKALSGLSLTFIFIICLGINVLQAQAPDLVVQSGHSQIILDITFSHDGKLLATGGYDRTIKIWDTETGTLLRTINNYDEINSLGFSRDGSMIVAGGPGTNTGLTMKVWDVESKELISAYPGSTVHELTFGSEMEGVIFSAHDDGGIGVWALVDTLDLVSYVTDSSGLEMLTLGLSDDDSIFAFGSMLDSAHYITISYLSPYELINEVEYMRRIRDVQFAHSNDLIIIAHADNVLEYEISLLNYRTAEELVNIVGYDPIVHPVHNELLLSNGTDTIVVFDLDKLELKRIWGVENNSLAKINVSPDGRLVAGAGDDGKIFIWDYASGELLRTIRSLPWTRDVSFSPDGTKLAFTGTENDVLVWDLENRSLQSIKEHTAAVELVEIAPNGRLMASAALDSTVVLYDLFGDSVIHSWTQNSNDFTSISIDPTSRALEIVTPGYLNTIDMLELAEDPTPVDYPLSQVIHGPEDKYIFIVAELFISIYEVALDANILSWYFEGSVKALAMSDDNLRLAAGGYFDTLSVLDVETLEPLWKVYLAEDYVESLDISSDGKILASGHYSGAIRFWDLETGELLSESFAHSSNVLTVQFRADSYLMASGSSDGMLILWDAEMGNAIANLYTFPNGNWAVVDPDGRFDASHAGNLEFLHFTIGMEPIELGQLKDRFYQPGLLQVLLGYSDDPLKDISGMFDVKLYPIFEVKLSDENVPELTITMVPREGGYGEVSVYVNGKQMIEDARPEDFEGNEIFERLIIKMEPYEAYFIGGKENSISVVVKNETGNLSSKRVKKYFNYKADAKMLREAQRFYGLMIGTSNYVGEEIDLKFADKDAEDFSAALTHGAAEFFGKKNVEIVMMNSTHEEAEMVPTKENIKTQFDLLAQNVNAKDVFVVFLSGHGVSHGGDADDFFYLTKDLSSTDLKDPNIRNNYAISSTELLEWMTSVKAAKQVLILDACGAGKLLDDMVAAKGNVSFKKVRALQDMKDKSGMYILAGAAADQVSYEASEYGQSLLTYSLLLGMSGPGLKDREFMNVTVLFDYALEKVPLLSRNIGGMQRPQVIMPKEGSFVIGQVTDPSQIPLSNRRPVLAFSTFQKESFPYTDDLHLAEKLDDHLSKYAIQTHFQNLVFSESKPYPGAFFVAGRYSLNGDAIVVKGGISRMNEQKVYEDVGITFEVEGTKSDLKGLLNEILTEIGAIFEYYE